MEIENRNEKEYDPFLFTIKGLLVSGTVIAVFLIVGSILFKDF